MNFKKSIELLIDWKKLPAYRAEPRVDFIIAGALPEIIKTRYRSPIKLIVPELPIRIGTIYSINSNKSYKVDFYVLLENAQNLFIEIKTDSKSRRDNQDKYLVAAKKIGMKSIIKGIVKIFKVTSYKKKYTHLIHKLKMAELLVEGKCEFVPNSRICEDIDILYIQPKSDQVDEIGFSEIAEIMKNGNDEMYQIFSNVLHKWAND